MPRRVDDDRSPESLLPLHRDTFQILVSLADRDCHGYSILRDIEELSYQEIVDLLEIPEGTVKSRINRGRIELAKILRRMKVLAVSGA